MALTDSPDRSEQRVIGTALRRLRERRGEFQGTVAKRLSITSQAWQKYEAGERRFTQEKLGAILTALDATPEDLDAERGLILGAKPRAATHRGMGVGMTEINVYGRARAGPRGIESYDVGEPMRTVDLSRLLGPSTGALEVAGDSMSPWAEPGEVVFFDRDRYTKRGSGCVIETHTGEYYLKLYERSDGSTIFARELNPEPRVISFALKEVKGVYGVRLRGD